MKIQPPEAILANIARLLREERTARGVSVYRLAKDCGLSQQMIHNLEKGTRNPTLNSLLRITSALNVDLPRLIKRASKKMRR
jgi:transcriptional regulator with XRE-family HTH domain